MYTTHLSADIRVCQTYAARGSANYNLMPSQGFLVILIGRGISHTASSKAAQS